MFPIKFAINLFRSVHHNSQTMENPTDSNCFRGGEPDERDWANDHPFHPHSHPPTHSPGGQARPGKARAKSTLSHQGPRAPAVLNGSWGVCESLKRTTSKAWVSLESRAVTTTVHFFICLTWAPAPRSRRPLPWNATACYFFAFSKGEWSGLTECNGMHSKCSLSLEAGTDWCLGGLGGSFFSSWKFEEGKIEHESEKDRTFKKGFLIWKEESSCTASQQSHKFEAPEPTYMRHGRPKKKKKAIRWFPQNTWLTINCATFCQPAIAK